MKKAAIYGKNDLRLEEIPIPQLAPGKVLIKVAYCAICGSDLHWLDGSVPIPALPYYPGHECTGIVEGVGEGVTTFQTGDKVACIPMANPCGKCSFCKQGNDTYCLNRNRQDLGGFAEYILQEERQVFALPKNVSLKVGTFVEPLSVVIHALDYSEIRAGNQVLIIGGGPIGLLLFKASLASGAGTVILSEPDDKRREFARNFGADIVIDPKNENLDMIIKANTSGLGVDIAFEAVGKPETCEQAIRSAKKGGKILFVGLVPPEKEIGLKPFEVFSKELIIRGVGINFHTYQRAVNLIERLDLESLITNEFDLKDLNEAIEFCRKREAIKTLIRC